MQLDKRTEADIVVCQLSGEINIDTSPELRKLCGDMIDKQIRKLVLDFSAVSYVDSSGLATLIEMLRKMKRYEGRLKICNLSDKVRSIFEITKLTKLFEIFDTEDQAKADF